MIVLFSYAIAFLWHAHIWVAILEKIRIFRVEEIKVRNFRVDEPWGDVQNAVCIMFDSDARQAFEDLDEFIESLAIILWERKSILVRVRSKFFFSVCLL